jgi:hypothetical protein
MSRVSKPAKQNGTSSAETIKASGYHRADRPDTRLHPTTTSDFTNSLQCGSHPHRTSWIGNQVPCVDGSLLARTFFTFAAWSVRPCVRPIDAVHMTAGHNALRGSGPGQNPAFEDAMAHVGCPDRRIDRHCITCCSPSQPSVTPDCRRDFVHAASATGSL